MPKLPILTAKEAERMLFNAGYLFIRSKGSHRIYLKDKKRIVVPFHCGKALHPKIVVEIFDAIK